MVSLLLSLGLSILFLLLAAVAYGQFLAHKTNLYLDLASLRNTLATDRGILEEGGGPRQDVPPSVKFRVSRLVYWVVLMVSRTVHGKTRHQDVLPLRYWVWILAFAGVLAFARGILRPIGLLLILIGFGYWATLRFYHRNYVNGKIRLLDGRVFMGDVDPARDAQTVEEARATLRWGPKLTGKLAELVYPPRDPDGRALLVEAQIELLAKMWPIGAEQLREHWTELQRVGYVHRTDYMRYLDERATGLPDDHPQRLHDQVATDLADDMRRIMKHGTAALESASPIVSTVPESIAPQAPPVTPAPNTPSSHPLPVPVQYEPWDYGYAERPNQLTEAEEEQLFDQAVEEHDGPWPYSTNDGPQWMPPARQAAATPIEAGDPVVGWTEFWSWCRQRGLLSRTDIDAATGFSTAGMTPAEVISALEARAKIPYNPDTLKTLEQYAKRGPNATFTPEERQELVATTIAIVNLPFGDVDYEEIPSPLLAAMTLQVMKNRNSVYEAKNPVKPSVPPA